MAGFHIFADLDLLTAADVNGYLMGQVVARYANGAERDAAGSPVEGMLSWVSGIGLQLYTAGAWHDLLSVTSVAGRTGVVTLTKADVGLANVDNTTDAAKPVSTATATALALKAPLASPAFTGTVTGVTKTMVGLGSVDNTTDAGKPVSTAAQAALDLKAPLASPAFTGTPTGLTKTHVGLSNVDNTADAAKPVSTAQAAADALRLALTGGTMTGSVNVLRTGVATAFTAAQTGDTQYRLIIGTDAMLQWGSGAAAYDTNLYRPTGTPDTLKTDDSFIVGANLAVTGTVGFNGTAPAAKPVVTGSRGGNAALASLLTGLAALGLITDSSSA